MMAYTAALTAKIEICWDGTNWVDETARCLMSSSVSYAYGLLGPGGSLAQLGEGPVAQLRCVMANADGRFSADRLGSQAATYGLFQKRIRFTAGYTSGTDPGPGTAVIWQGRIQDVQESEQAAEVTLACYGHDLDLQQQRPQIAAVGNKRIDELVSLMASAAGYTNVALERGYTVVPWFYSDGDDCLAAMREVAEAEGALVWLDPQDTKLKLWTWGHWIGANSVEGWGRDRLEEARPRRDYANAYDTVNVSYQPRRRGRLVSIHQLTKPIVVPPSGTVTERLRFRWPMIAMQSYTVRARSSGGENLDTYLGMSPAAPQGALYWEVTFTNSHTRHALVVDKFDVIGWPIEGLPNREYRCERNSLDVHRQTDVRPEVRRTEVKVRYALQHEAQARLVAELKSWRLQEPPLVLQIGPVPGDPRLHVGDVVQLSLGDGISQIEELVVLLHRQGSYGGPEQSCRWQEVWTAAALDDLYQYPTVSTGTGDGTFVVGTSRLSYGRLGY